jgi:hypothetical protein
LISVRQGDVERHALLDRVDVEADHWRRDSVLPEAGKIRLTDPVSKFIPGIPLV